MQFTKAIVRTPGANFAQGITTGSYGQPDYALALQQHECYCAALQQCGLAVTHLPVDLDFPDSTFVEDTAILTPYGAMISRPGASSRAGEVLSMRTALAGFYPTLAAIEAPGTMDGGDICEAGKHFFIGISERTNLEGAQQLGEWLAGQGYSWSTVDIRGVPGILHLKSGIAYLGDARLAVIPELAARDPFDGYELVAVPAEEAYAANCVRVNDYLLVAAGFPRFEAALRGLGGSLIVLDMSEYRKMDGGLSCLSLRF